MSKQRPPAHIKKDFEKSGKVWTFKEGLYLNGKIFAYSYKSEDGCTLVTSPTAPYIQK